MSERATATPAPSPELAQLRRRLTVWYAATFGVILVLLGFGLFVVVRAQLGRQLDRSLSEAALELGRAARIRELEAGAPGRVVDAVDELRIPDRTLYLLDSAGAPVRPDTADAFVQTVARQAARDGRADAEREISGERTLRAHAERVALGGGRHAIAVAVADRIELEDRYASLIAAFGAAAVAALVLVALGGGLLVRQSTAPVERSMEQMRRFMADAAHELRTPLAVVRTRAEVALQQPRDAETYVAALSGIEAEAGRLGRLVDDLLTLARVDAGERRVERTRVYLDDVTLDAAGAARVVAQAKGVDLAVDEYEEAAVDGDPALLRQLVLILLDNAVKFTPAGGRVGVRVHTAAGRATLVVTDTGVGIPAEQLPHAFERFWRGDAARTRETGGAGLGLSIARWIADAHGAQVRLDSTPGVGTRASVEFREVPAGA